MRRTVMASFLLVVLAAFLGSACALGRDAVPAAQPLRAASFNFEESRVLAWLYALAFEAAGVEVDTARIQPGGTREIISGELSDDEVDFVPEYVGSLLNFLGGTPGSDGRANLESARALLAPRGVSLLSIAPAQNQNAFVVTRRLSDELQVRTLSDLAPHAPSLTLGAPPECPDRQLCAGGLRDVYGIAFGEFLPQSLDARVAALQGGQVDVALLFTTDATIAERDWVILEDDRRLQPAENIALAIRTEALEGSAVDLGRVADAISASLTLESLQALNRRVQIDGLSAEAAAREWLLATGVLSAVAPPE